MVKLNHPYIKHIIISLVISAFILVGCAENDNTVADFGDHSITLDEYKIAYSDVVKKPNVFDSKELREQFLDELIASRLLAEEARRLKLDEDERLQYKINAYREKCLREEHHKSVIYPKIEISEDDIEEAYLFTQEQRKMSHLFTEDETEARRLYNLLNSGETFENLAKKVFFNTGLANTGGDLGWVNWDQMDYDLAMTVFRQPINEFSEPVKSTFGYHIIKVTDFKKKPLISRQEYEQHRRKAKYMLEYKIGDKYSYEYISNMMKDVDVKIYPDILLFVKDKLDLQLTREPHQFNQMYDMQLSNDEVKYIEESLWERRNEVMATINGVEYTIGIFIGALNYIPYEIVQNNFKAAFDYAIRDFLITEEAKSLGLQESENVTMKADLFNEFLIQMKLRRKLVREVTVDEMEIRNYYEQNKSTYKKATYDQVKDLISENLKRQKRTDVIPDYVAEISKDLTIEKNVDIIHNYYDGILGKN